MCFTFGQLNSILWTESFFVKIQILSYLDNL